MWRWIAYGSRSCAAQLIAPIRSPEPPYGRRDEPRDHGHVGDRNPVGEQEVDRVEADTDVDAGREEVPGEDDEVGPGGAQRAVRVGAVQGSQSHVRTPASTRRPQAIQNR